jgi:N-acetyl-gamma-glutamyl-phosphate reductase
VRGAGSSSRSGKERYFLEFFATAFQWDAVVLFSEITMKPKVYVDGQEGTTGLRIHEHLAARADVEVLRIDAEKRKDVGERRRLINAADVVFLCLPDAASKEAVALVENERTKVIDASTAFRTDAGWAYGLPELGTAQREKIRISRRIANPGCHATAFLLPVAPLVAMGIIRKEAVLTCVSLTGYSGAGKKAIALYEGTDAPAKLKGPRPYGLKLMHKHLPEMRTLAGLMRSPIFTPVICAIHSGLAVITYLPPEVIGKKASAAEVHAVLTKQYAGEKFVRVMPFDAEGAAGLDEGQMDIMACNGTNRADVFVFGHDEQIVVAARLDNLGKGASGAAVQCMNLALGFDEGAGLTV